MEGEGGSGRADFAFRGMKIKMRIILKFLDKPGKVWYTVSDWGVWNDGLPKKL